MEKFLNLQLFATQTTLLNSQGNDLSPEMKTYYHDKLIDEAEPYLVHDQFGSKYPIPKNGGKTIEFRKYTPLAKALKPLTEGVTPQGNKLDVQTVTATVEQYGDYIELSDMLEFTAIDRNVEEATKILSSQAGRTLDTVTRDIITAGTNKMFAPKVSGGVESEILLRADMDTTSELTPKVIRKAAAVLKQQNARPIDDSFVAIIHPDVACDLQGNSEWIESHKYAAPENIYQGEIGKIAGVRFVESTEAKIIGPSVISDDLARLTVKEEVSSSVTVKINEVLTAGTYAGDAAIPVYVNGMENTIVAIDTSAGETTLTLGAAASASAGALICGQGAGKDGTAIYCTMVIGLNAYGTTEVSGMGLQHIIKQLGSGGTTDPLNQRSTTGWKASKVAERLVEQYMVRIEHSSASFGKEAVSN